MRDPRHPRHFTDEFKRQIVEPCNAGKPKREAMVLMFTKKWSE